MNTASFFVPLPAGLIGISIARRSPPGFDGPSYQPLAPGGWFRSYKTPQQYRERYFAEILGKLDPEKVVADLERLAGDGEPTLLCWESPTSASWCHRSLVSAWLHDQLGMGVKELGLEAHGYGWKHPKLHPSLAADGVITQPGLPFGPSTTTL